MKYKNLDMVPRIDWRQAPDWAEWWAMDRDGESFWFEKEPVRGEREWECCGGEVRIAPAFKWSALFWTKSLVYRSHSETPDTLPRESLFRTANAEDYLNIAAAQMEDRAASRDAEDGERSMARAVDAFNALYGFEMTETQGWQFMSILKKARGAQGEYREDDYVDDVAYCALAAEAASKHV